MGLIYYAGLPVVWALLLVFLVAWARQERRTLGRQAPAAGQADATP